MKSPKSTPKLTYGDEVTCKIKGNSIVDCTDTNFDVKLQFKIIGYSFIDEFYILHIPRYYNIENSWQIERKNLIEFSIKKKYLYQNAVAIKQFKIFAYNKKDTNQDGMNCSKCNNFYHMACSNQPDGTLICWSCRANPYRH